jgi:hypothetical protein
VDDRVPSGHGDLRPQPSPPEPVPPAADPGHAPGHQRRVGRKVSVGGVAPVPHRDRVRNGCCPKGPIPYSASVQQAPPMPQGAAQQDLGGVEGDPVGDRRVRLHISVGAPMVPIMMVGTPNSWPARILRLLMLALGIVATPSVGVEALQAPHCPQHERAGQHAASSSMAHEHDLQSWSQRHDHGCAHCPASECARVSPCTGSSSTAVPPSRATVDDLRSHRVAVDLARRQAPSAVSSPDTPPPQLIA